jgi:large subunit ribosomal protein L18
MEIQMAKSKFEARKRRRVRIRQKVSGTPERPRLSIFRSNKHIYAQVVDDEHNRVLAAASDRGQAPAADAGADKKVARAKLVGVALAEACKEQGITTVTFDRGGYKYHGRVKALAEAAREKGLVF